MSTRPSHARPARARPACRGAYRPQWTVRTTRLMVGIPDYQTYVDHRRTTHPDQPVMTYEEFFVERQNARHAVGKGRFRGCC